MCLMTISKKFNPPDPKVRKGWKFVSVGENGLYGVYRELHRYSNEWQTASTGSFGSLNLIRTNDPDWNNREEYTAGFHVFPTREEARKAKRALTSKDYGTFNDSKETVRLAKVEVRDVTYEGIDGTSTDKAYKDARVKTLVANQMRIVGVVKD